MIINYAKYTSFNKNILTKYQFDRQLTMKQFKILFLSLEQHFPCPGQHSPAVDNSVEDNLQRSSHAHLQ